MSQVSHSCRDTWSSRTTNPAIAQTLALDDQYARECIAVASSDSVPGTVQNFQDSCHSAVLNPTRCHITAALALRTLAGRDLHSTRLTLPGHHRSNGVSILPSLGQTVDSGLNSGAGHSRLQYRRTASLQSRLNVYQSGTPSFTIHVAPPYRSHL